MTMSNLNEQTSLELSSGSETAQTMVGVSASVGTPTIVGKNGAVSPVPSGNPFMRQRKFRTRTFINSMFKVNNKNEYEHLTLKDLNEIDRDNVYTYHLLTQKWDLKLKEKFERWYVKRQEKRTSLVVSKSFTQWMVVYFNDVLHHINNFEKERLRKERKKPQQKKTLNKYKIVRVKNVSRPKENGKHPHMDLALPQSSASMMPIWKIENPCEKNYQTINMGIKAQSGPIQEDSITKVENTTFTDQRETIVDDGYITSQTQPNLQQVSMPEQEWHVRNIMSKPVPFWNGEWSVGNKQGEIIKQWIVPGETLFGPHYNQVATFTFFRGHPTIRFQINGTKFHSGRLIAAFIPAYQFSEFDDKLYTISSLTALPHVILDASIANSGELNLPFVHMNTYFNSVAKGRGWQSLGTLVLAVYNNLRAATTSSQQIGVTAWVHFDNCELHQPTFAHDVTFPGVKVTAKAQSGIEGLVKSAIPMIKDLVAPELSFASGVMGGAENMDKPTDPIEIQRWVPNAVTGLCTGEGIDRASRLCLKPGSYTVPDADLISTTQDDMNLLELCKIPVRLDLVEWQSSKPSGTRLAHVPICPNLFSGYSTNEAVKPNVEIIEPTLLAYISRYFKFWRGSLKYKIQIVASQMHTGRIMISYGAGINLSAANFQKSSYLNTYIVDLQEKHEVEFAVPFMAERPWLRCDRFRQHSDEEYVTEYNWENVGYLDIYVLNRLSRPESVATDVSINILISAGDDFELAFPSDLRGFQGIGVPIVPPAKAQSGQEQTVTTRTDDSTQSITRGSGLLSSRPENTMGENAMDLKSLLRRYCLVYHVADINVGDGTNTLTFQNNPSLSGVNKCFNTQKGVQTRTALAHFSQLFTFWRGSIRYKLVWQVVNNTVKRSDLTLRVQHYPGMFSSLKFGPTTVGKDQFACGVASDSMGIILGTSRQQGSLEFEVPFYTPYTQLRTFAANLPNARVSTGTIIVYMDTPNKTGDTVISVKLYQAAGDDFTLNYLRAAPRVQFCKAYDTTRDLTDNCVELNPNSWPPICSQSDALLFSEGKEQENPQDEEEEPIPENAKAQALIDYVIPGISNNFNNTCAGVQESTSKLTEVCDTMGGILQQAKKKLGINDDEDEEAQEATTLIEDVQSCLSPLTPYLDGMISYLRLTSEKTSAYLNTHLSAAEILTEVANVVSGITAYAASSTFLTKVCAVVTIVSTLLKGITSAIKNNLYHFVTKVFGCMNGSKQGNQLPNEIKAETFSLDLIAPLTATLAVAIGAVGFKKIPTDKETVDMCKGLSEKLRLFNFSSLALTNVKSVWNEMKELMQWCVDYIMNLISPQMLAQLKLEREFEDIEEWAKFIDDTETQAYTDKIHYDYIYKNKINRAIDKGKYYNRLLLEGKCGRAASIIREYVRKITEIGVNCDKSKNELPYRKDPFCIAMCGSTNIGKSGCITSIGYDVMDALEYPQHNRWCAVNCTEAYFSENYRQQSAIYFDDFSTFTSEEQYAKFFNLKSNTAFPLDMAFRKGEYFNSDFIFMTTNSPYPQPNFMTNQQAFLRRRDILIEADWVRTEEVKEALRNGRSMRTLRKLDNSHLRFRIKSSSNETAQPGPWMNYEALIKYCADEAREHMKVQQLKLTHDLTRAGYIVPQAQSKIIRKIKIDNTTVITALKQFSPEMFEKLEYDAETDSFDLFSDTDDEDLQEWQECNRYFEVLGINLQKALKQNSYEIKPKITTLTKITGSLQKFKEYLTISVENILKAHPWLRIVGKWSMILAGALLAFSATYYGTKKLVHVCACHALRYYGYRCGFCGKWPSMKNVKYTDWMMGEWQKVYANEPYEDGRITTIEEENSLKSVITQRTVIEDEMSIGTNKAQGIYSEVTKGATPTRIMANVNPYSQDVSGQTQIKTMAHSGTTDQVMNARVFPYLYRLRTMGGIGTPSVSLNGFAIGGRKVLINQHFFYGMKDGDHFEIFHSGAWMPIEFNDDQGLTVKGKDLVIYEMPKQFNLHKDNTDHFISETELATFQKGKAIVCKLDQKFRETVEVVNIAPLKELKYELDVAGKSIPYYIQKAWHYKRCCAAGDCGSLVIADSNKLSGKILGLHVAGDINLSFAQLVTRELLAGAVTSKLGTPVPMAQAKFGNIIPRGHLGRIGQAEKGKGSFQADKTLIIPTVIQGMISPPATFPSVLSPRDKRLVVPINPLSNGIAKYAHVAMPFPRKHRRIVNELMKEEVRLLTRQRRPAPLTMDQACNGIDGLEGYARLPRGTSPGYPWTLTRSTTEKGKSYLFTGELLETPIFELVRSVNMREEKAKQRERVESVWVDCLKDERRPWKKIETGSTRVFTIPPVDFSILLRKYTLDFSAAVWASRKFSDCKVGIDPQSIEWTELYYWLAEFSPFCIAGDFSRFDGSIPADIIDDVREDIDFFYQEFGDWTQEDANVLEMLFDEIIHTVTLAKQDFYMTHMGNGSGNPLTVIINSRVNRRYMALAWLGLAERNVLLRKYCSMAEFRRCVRQADYGDDNLLSVIEEVLEWYNQETIAAYLAEFGIIYTNETKTGTTKFKPLDECTFLKQSFHDHESLKLIKVPHMAQQTILELLNWTRDAGDQDELLFSNIDDALRFAYFYGEKYFNQLRVKIMNALEQVDLKHLPATYSDKHHWFLQTIGNR